MDAQLITENQQKLEKEKQRLEKLLGQVAERKDEGGKENFETKYPNISDDMDDNAIEVEMYGNNIAEEKTLQAKLTEVNEALQRISQGTYGKCSVGGEEIEEARLRVVPEALTCVKHSQ